MSAPEALVAELRRELIRFQRESPAPSATIALFRGSEVLWAESVGLADVESGREATPDSQYAIASITKTFVARAILVLRDEEQLSLDDPLGTYIPEAAREGVTVRRTLAHLSGVQREPPGDVWESLEMPDREALLQNLDRAEQVLEPGRQWHYSNLVYALLGEIVARLSGTSCERFVEERILQPLGLETTTWGPGENAATGYFVERFADVAVPEPVIDKKAFAPAGALWSTVGDLARWGAFLMGQDDMHAVQVMADQERWLLGWGLGLMLHRRGERLFAGHDGGTVGHSSFLTYSRREKVGTVLLTNTENPATTFDPVALDRQGRRCAPARGRAVAAGRAGAEGARGRARHLVGRGDRLVVRVAARQPGGAPARTGGRRPHAVRARVARTSTEPSPAASTASCCGSCETRRASP